MIDELDAPGVEEGGWVVSRKEKHIVFAQLVFFSKYIIKSVINFILKPRLRHTGFHWATSSLMQQKRLQFTNIRICTETHTSHGARGKDR